MSRQVLGQGATWDVALLPRAPHGEEICIAVDVLRASSMVVTALALGAQEVVAVPSLVQARKVARLSRYLLCGERGGLPPPGFHLGNSPSQLRAEAIRGRGLVLTTSNGTPLLARLRNARHVLIASLLNREAVAKAALALGGPVHIICAGEERGKRLALEDVIGAGAVVEAALRLRPALALGEGARLALMVFLAAQGDLEAALASTTHGSHLVSLGLGQDVRFCARLDVWQVVPRLHPESHSLVLHP